MPSNDGLPLQNIAQEDDWLGSMDIEPTIIKDAFGFDTFNVSSAQTRLAKATESLAAHDASWLPNASVAREWLSFVEQKHHPILPKVN